MITQKRHKACMIYPKGTHLHVTKVSSADSGYQYNNVNSLFMSRTAINSTDVYFLRRSGGFRDSLGRSIYKSSTMNNGMSCNVVNKEKEYLDYVNDDKKHPGDANMGYGYPLGASMPHYYNIGTHDFINKINKKLAVQ